MKTRAKSVNAPPKVKVKVKCNRELTKADLERVVGGASGANQTHTDDPETP
jgi:hypothetical protein